MSGKKLYLYDDFLHFNDIRSLELHIFLCDVHVYGTEGNICQKNLLNFNLSDIIWLRDYILKGDKGLWFYFESVELLNGVNKIINSKYSSF